MKKLTKRIAALVLAAMTALTLGVMANAVTVSKEFKNNTDYDITFKLSATVSVLAGAAYKLDVVAEETNKNPYYYPYLYIKGVLYGTGSQNSVTSQTFTNACNKSVSTNRSVNDCRGKGFGEFRAYGNDAYGEVRGSIDVY